MSTYIVRSSQAKMPSSCWGRYRRVAVLEVEDGIESVSMISTHARGVIRIVQTWEKLNVGLGIRDAYSRALKEAEDLCYDLISKSKTDRISKAISCVAKVAKVIGAQ